MVFWREESTALYEIVRNEEGITHSVQKTCLFPFHYITGMEFGLLGLSQFLSLSAHFFYFTVQQDITCSMRYITFSSFYLPLILSLALSAWKQDLQLLRFYLLRQVTRHINHNSYLGSRYNLSTPVWKLFIIWRITR